MSISNPGDPIEVKPVHVVRYHDKKNITSLPRNHYLVFGSNSAGIHGAGAARAAHQYFGAKYGTAFGHMGQSYAVPTREHIRHDGIRHVFNDIPFRTVKMNIAVLLKDIAKHPDREYVFTRIGCGNAGYLDCEIAPLFCNAPKNCIFPKEWLDFIPHGETEATFVQL